MQRPALTWKRVMRRRISGMLKAMNALDLPPPFGRRVRPASPPGRRIDKVMCRYQPCQLRTSSPSSPTACLAVSKHSSTGQRRSGHQAGGGRAEHDVVGHRVRLGERAAHQQPVGACCRRNSRNRAQSYRRSPFAPALRRRQPSRGSADPWPAPGSPPDQRPQRRLDRQHTLVLFQPEAQPTV